MQFKKIILLAGKWDTTPLVYNFLAEKFQVAAVILEERVPRKVFLKKRIKKLGLFAVGGQVLFQLLTGKMLSKRSRKRVAEIIQHYRLSATPIPPAVIIPVESVNSDNCLQALQKHSPDLVIVHGTRIISKKILNNVPATFINIHAGITPRYRGSHGAYWALANNDSANAGVTVHLVDTGIDTGGILAQGPIPIQQRDNFATYPYLQLAEGLLLLEKVIHSLEAGNSVEQKNELSSGLWHHPTLWGYWWTRITKKVK